jgi:autotransporter-associated beta strand protein
LNKLGSGTLTLSNVNFFTGAVNLNVGLIKAAALYNLGNGTALNFNGGGLQFDGVYDPSVRSMTFQAGGATFDTQTNDIVFANSIGNNGSGGLTKNGSGILELKGALSYNGDTVINGGQLKIDNNLCNFMNAFSGVGDLVVEGASTVLIVSSFNGNALNVEPDAKVILASPTDTLNVSTIAPDITTAALTTFEVANGARVVGTISGGGIQGQGKTQVDIGASLTAQSIKQDTLTIGSGATVTISPIPGGPLSGTMLPVPEPSVFVLLACALVVFIRRLRR